MTRSTSSAIGDSTAVLELDTGFKYTAAGGTVGDLKRSTGAVAGIAKGKYKTEGGTKGTSRTTGTSLRSTNLFPTGSRLDGNTPGRRNSSPRPTAPKNADNEDEPTINPITKNPAFQINEELDSLSIRYTDEQGGGKPSVQAYGPGNSRLETVGSLVTWPVNDTTFIERQRYELEVLAIDLAGNASVAKEGYAHVQRGLR